MASAFTYLIAFFLLVIVRGPGILNSYLSQEFTVYNTGIVIISGASSGIGKHAAFELANSGFTVYAGVRSEKDALKIRGEAQSLKTEGKMKGDMEPVILDVTKEDTIEAVREKVENSGLPLVAVVNNAGFSVRYPAEQTNISLSKDVFEINYWGSIRLTTAMLPLIRQHKGRVIFVSSVAAMAWAYGSSIYSGTKRATEAFADSLRLEMTEFGVSVSIVQPGYIKTNIEHAGKTTTEDVGLAKDSLSPYEFFWNFAHKNRESSFSNAPGPEVTSEVIKDSIVNPFPKSRYVVGPASTYLTGYQISIFLPFFPDRVVDFLSLKEFKKLDKKN